MKSHNARLTEELNHRSARLSLKKNTTKNLLNRLLLF